MISYTIVTRRDYNLENHHVLGFARMMCCTIVASKGIFWIGVIVCPASVATYDVLQYTMRKQNIAAHHACKSKNMAIFEIMRPTIDDSVRNHTQTSQSTTKHDVFMFTETLPTNECRQFFFFFYNWRHSFVGSVSVNMNTSCLVVLWEICV